MEEPASILTVDIDVSVWVDTKGSTVNKVQRILSEYHPLTNVMPAVYHLLSQWSYVFIWAYASLT